MQITIQFFAHMRDIAGGSEKMLTVPDGATVADVQTLLAGTDSRFGESFPSCRIAVNDEWATADTKLAGGDSVAFIPPVSGG